jgi:hypothetical protein
MIPSLSTVLNMAIGLKNDERDMIEVNVRYRDDYQVNLSIRYIPYEPRPTQEELWASMYGEEGAVRIHGPITYIRYRIWPYGRGRRDDAWIEIQ